MNFENAVNIEDLRHCARSHVPRAVLGYVEGGVEDGIGMARNRDAFDAVRLVPRYLLDTSRRTQTSMLFGREYKMPLGVAPSLPTAFLVVVFHSSCVALAYDLSGAAVDQTLTVRTANGNTPLNAPGSGCQQGFAEGLPFSPRGVAFPLPPGIGARKNVTVAVVDAGGDSSLTQTSNATSFWNVCSYF